MFDMINTANSLVCLITHLKSPLQYMPRKMDQTELVAAGIFHGKTEKTMAP